MSDAGHVPVLLDQVLETLRPGPGERVFDGTVGRGGHAAAMIPRLGPGGVYVALDADPANVAFARERLTPIAERASVRLSVIHSNFAEAERVLAAHGFERVDVLLLDLGFASNQMDDPARGLSFMADGPLDMRLDPTRPTTAAELIGTLPQRELADLIYEYGEERRSRAIARKIVERRGQSPITRTGELAELVRRAYGPVAGRSRIHPATRTFQALRIAVNDELGVLERLLGVLPRLVASGGRAGVISFHSLEDRRVKQSFVSMERAGLGRRVTRRPVRPTDEQVAANPRCRSARLRVFAFDGSTDRPTSRGGPV